MAVVRATVAYDGTDFFGWARQPGLRTVEGVLMEAAGAELTVAGRTDRGVHAVANVVSFRAERVPAAAELNARLPEDVAVLAVEAAPEGFDARGSARSRSYVYRITTAPAADVFRRRYELHRPRSVDLGLLQACAAAVVGRHDFTAFTPTETQHVFFQRTVTAAEWVQEGDRLEFRITADALLRHMVRILVGTMLEMRDLDRFTPLLEGRPRSEAGSTAPPHGLTFVAAGYGDATPT
jgi:tRNA pseudouridine38-40 synthase